jgi:hypothetical protein
MVNGEDGQQTEGGRRARFAMSSESSRSFGVGGVGGWDGRIQVVVASRGQMPELLLTTGTCTSRLGGLPLSHSGLKGGGGGQMGGPGPARALGLVPA